MVVIWYAALGVLATTQAFPIPFWTLPSKGIITRSVDPATGKLGDLTVNMDILMKKSNDEGIIHGLKKFIKRQYTGSYYPYTSPYYPYYQSGYYPQQGPYYPQPAAAPAPAAPNPWLGPWPTTPKEDPADHQGDRGASPCDSPQALNEPVACAGGSFQIHDKPDGPYAAWLGGKTREGSFNTYTFGAQVTPAFQPFGDFGKVSNAKSFNFNGDEGNNNNNNNGNVPLL